MADAVADQDQKPWDLYGSQKPWELYGPPPPESIDQEDSVLQPSSVPPDLSSSTSPTPIDFKNLPASVAFQKTQAAIPPSIFDPQKDAGAPDSQSFKVPNLTPVLSKQAAQKNIADAASTALNTGPLDVAHLTPEGLQSASDYLVSKLPQILQKPVDALTAPTRAIDKTALGIADWMSRPSGMAQLAGASLPVAKIPMAIKFFHDMATGAGEGAYDMVEKWKSGDYQGFADSLVGTMANVLGAGALGVHGVKSGVNQLKGGEPNASSQQEATAVHGDLRAQPVGSEGQVPAQEGGGGVQPQAEAVQAQVPLNDATGYGGNVGSPITVTRQLTTTSEPVAYTTKLDGVTEEKSRTGKRIIYYHFDNGKAVGVQIEAAGMKDLTSDEAWEQAKKRMGAKAAPEVPLTESKVESLPADKQGALTHSDGIQYGLTKGAGDVASLQDKYDAATKEQVSAFQSGDGVAAKAAFGKANFYGGALMGATRGEHPISGSNYENFLKAHPELSPTTETGAESTKNGQGVGSAPAQSSAFKVVSDEGSGEHHIVNSKGEIVETYGTAEQAHTDAGKLNEFTSGEKPPEEKPFLDEEDQKHFDAERKNVGVPVELTDDAKTTHPFAKDAIAWADRDTGKIHVNKDALKYWLDRTPKRNRKNLISSILDEEQTHLATSDEDALNYWNSLSPWEKYAAKRTYTGGYDLKMNNVNWGHEALRIRRQRMAGMTPAEVLRAVGKEKWTLAGLHAVEASIRTVRRVLSGKLRARQDAILRRVEDNVRTAKWALNGKRGPQPAARGRRPNRPDSKEQQEFVLPGIESTRLAGSKIAASNKPGQEGSELPRTPDDVKAAQDAAVAAKVPQRPTANEFKEIGEEAIDRGLDDTLKEAKEGKNVRLPNLKDFTAELKKTWSALKPGEISDLWSGTVGKFIDTASGEDLRVLGKSAFGGNARKILTDKEINEKFGEDTKAAVEYAKSQEKALTREGKKSSSIWNAPVPDAPKPGEGAIGDFQKAEMKQHELEQNLRNAIDGGDPESAARIRSGIADIKHHILHKLKEPYKAAVQAQKRRGWISSALFRKMVKPEVPDSEGILNRKAVTPDDVRPSNDGKHSSYTYLGGMPESKVAEALSDKARRSSSDSATVTRRVAVLEDKRTGTVHIVSAYDHPHGPDVEHDVRILDPLSPTRTHLPITEVLKRYKPLYSVFLDQPVRKFRQDFSDVDEYNDKFGNQAKADVENAQRYSPESVSPAEFAQEAGGRISEGSGGSFQGPHRDLVAEPQHGAAEVAETTPLTGTEERGLLAHVNSFGEVRSFADVKRVLQEASEKRPNAVTISALRKMAHDVHKAHPDWDQDALLNDLAHKIYEKSIQAARTVEEGGQPKTADTGEDAGTGKSAQPSPQDQPTGPLSRAAEPKDVTPPMAFNRRKLEEKRDETMTDLGVAKQRVANAFKRSKTSAHMASTIDGMDTIANNMGQNAEWSVRMESSDGAKNRIGYAKDFRGKRDILESGPAFLSAGGVKTIYNYDARAMAEKARLLREDPQFLQWSMKLKAMLGGPNRKDIPYAQKELGAALEKRLIEKGFLHHKDAQYVYNNDAKDILDKFMAQIRTGDEAAKRMSDRGNVWDKYRGRKWLKSNEKIMRSLEFAKAHWDNPEVRSTARRIKMEMDRQFDLERDNGYNISYDPDYLPGRYDGDTWSPSGMLFGGQRILGKQFRAAAKFDNIYEAASKGPYIPASLDGASLVGSRVRQGMHSVARRMWWDSLKELKDENGNFVAKPAKVTDGRAGSPSPEYVPFNMPGTTDRIYIHQGYSGLVHQLVDPSALQHWALTRGALETGQFLKHTVLLGDVFHLGRVAYYGASIMGKNGKFKPGWAATAIREEDLDRAVKSGIIAAKTRDYLKEKVPFRIGPKADMISRSRLSELYERSGLNTGRIQDAIFKDLVRNVPGFSAYNRFLFDRFTTGMMKTAALQEFDRLTKLDPEKDSRQIVQESAKALNDYFGSIGRQGWIKSATFQDVARMGLLAPQWLEGLIKKEVQPVKLLTSPLNALTGRDTAFRGIGRGLVSMLVLTQVINLINRGTPTWMNQESDHKWDAYVGGGNWLSPLAVFNELTSDVLRLWETKQRKWDIAQQIGANKLGFWGRVATVLASGNAPSGEYQSTTGGVLTKAAEQLVPTPISFGTWTQFAGHMLAPGTVPPVPPGQLLQKAFSTMGVKTHVGLDPVQKAHLAAEMFKSAHGIQEPKIQFTDEPANSKLRYQLKIGDEAGAAKTLTALRKTHTDGQILNAMEQWSRRPFTSKENEYLFVSGMDNEGRRVYQMAIQQRYDEVNNFLDWYTKQPVK